MPLSVAASYYAVLESYLADPDSEWDVAYFLRELCLGREIEPEQMRALNVEGSLLFDDTGELFPEMRAVVLSSLRGEGRQLHVASPFTDPLDRAIAQYMIARDYIRTRLDDHEAKSTLEYDPVDQELRRFRRHRKWAEREDEREPPGPPLP